VETPQSKQRGVKMLEEHKAELAQLQKDYEILKVCEHEFSMSIWALIEGRISDLESMIAIDKYWENR
jgi:hypothetical protein